MTREQFIALVKSEQEALRGFLLALCCGKRDDADDIAQETLVKAYLSSSAYRDKGKFRAWLFTIARNTFLNHKASKRTFDDISAARSVASATSADSAFRHQELYMALATLSPKERLGKIGHNPVYPLVQPRICINTLLLLHGLKESLTAFLSIVHSF